jgi:hypothetical protein
VELKNHTRLTSNNVNGTVDEVLQNDFTFIFHRMGSNSHFKVTNKNGTAPTAQNGFQRQHDMNTKTRFQSHMESKKMYLASKIIAWLQKNLPWSVNTEQFSSTNSCGKLDTIMISQISLDGTDETVWNRISSLAIG